MAAFEETPSTTLPEKFEDELFNREISAMTIHGLIPLTKQMEINMIELEIDIKKNEIELNINGAILMNNPAEANIQYLFNIFDNISEKKIVLKQKQAKYFIIIDYMMSLSSSDVVYDEKLSGLVEYYNQSCIVLENYKQDLKNSIIELKGAIIQ
jgi:hypothetical protein